VNSRNFAIGARGRGGRTLRIGRPLFSFAGLEGGRGVAWRGGDTAEDIYLILPTVDSTRHSCGIM